MYKTRSMEDEILKIMAAEIAGENVTKEEREKMNRWWEEKRGNERTYKMLMGELGEVVRLVRQQGGLDREKAYERLESDIRKKMTVRELTPVSEKFAMPAICALFFDLAVRTTPLAGTL